ncbi:MAG: hypothetical protein U0736_13230 [Gemmataceae bacterium]
MTRADKLTGFDGWLGSAAAGGTLTVFSLPQVIRRARRHRSGLLTCRSQRRRRRSRSPPERGALESDGLEWRCLGVLWQQVLASPLRRTQQGGLFWRDVERLESDPLLNAAPPDHLADVPDLGFWLAAVAEGGLLREVDGEVRAEAIPTVWELGLWPAVEALWAELFPPDPGDPARRLARRAAGRQPVPVGLSAAVRPAWPHAGGRAWAALSGAAGAAGEPPVLDERVGAAVAPEGVGGDVPASSAWRIRCGWYRCAGRRRRALVRLSPPAAGCSARATCRGAGGGLSADAAGFSRTSKSSPIVRG